MAHPSRPNSATQSEESTPERKSAPLIEVRELVKIFGGRPVIDGLDLTVDRGETVVIIGGSGCGKTTLARVLMALERPTSGSVRLEGIELTALSDKELTAARSRFAMVFQTAALLDSLNVFDNVAFPLREETDLDESDIRERVLAQLGELGLGDAVERLPAELSGGMAKRVGIARAMITEPEILVYDEPTSGLDPIGARLVDGLVEQVRERCLVTSVVITHDMVTAYEIADRVVLLARGKIVACGPPEELFRSHSDDLRPFAISSGVDLDKLAPRSARKSPAEIRARYGARTRVPRGRKPWYQRMRLRVR